MVLKGKVKIDKTMKEKIREAVLPLYMEKIPKWKKIGNKISRSFQKGSFEEAIGFTHKIAKAISHFEHNPVISIQDEWVAMTLFSTDVGGLTKLDFEIAQTIDELHKKK